MLSTVYVYSLMSQVTLSFRIFGTSIFGINIAQGWVYVNTNNDPWHLRLLVSLLFKLLGKVD